MSAGAGERVELGRYTISAGERVLYGQRVLGVVRVVDVPAGGGGRRYIVDIWIALAWCVGILIVAYTFAMATYRRKLG